MVHGNICNCKDCGDYALIKDVEDPRLTKFDRPLPFFGCGIGWGVFLLGFLCPIIWYAAAAMHICKYYNRDPRERSGLTACSVMAVLCTVAVLIVLAVVFIK
ncbi:60S ribosomal protein L18a-like protein [Carex littledalei]|uniref:60S ribosomal protein L18a-like protein n=1 Tax=Carex littledalei TaxID=544730 RepID=A0A833VKI7_9POAL|nr:60S ribosomal protein L18a-like protein [Carex littledalei]